MCGIVAYTGTRAAAPLLLQGLADLEYRGYDSAGVALAAPAEGSPLRITRREGKLANLRAALADASPDSATAGIGHTRWATHGRPTDANAHPHRGCGDEVAIVHNGIVENYAELRTELLANGHTFSSETDTETIAHLVEAELAGGVDLFEALRRASLRLDGSQAIVAMSPSEPGVVVSARLGNAGGVVIGLGDGENYLASDLAAVVPHTRRVGFLADGQMARLTPDGVTCSDLRGEPVELSVTEVPHDPVRALKGQYAHFMLKEIMEQPVALADTIGSLLNVDPPELTLNDLDGATERLATVERVKLIAMGTSYHAALAGRQFFEELAGLPAEIENASEFRYRRALFGPETLVVSVSQSGETVDVLEAMAIARDRGAPQVTICNTPGGQTTRVADGTVYTHAGLERGVASTKTFVTSIVALYALALKLGRDRGVLGDDELAERVADLSRLPRYVAAQLRDMEPYRAAAKVIASADHLLFLGRSQALPVAMEGALKMKEISYVHAEAYAAGEMKHGPIALIDEGFPTIAVATRNALREKIISNIEQVRARGGPVVAVVTEGDAEVESLASVVLPIPAVPADLEPIVATIPLQCLAYYVALARGCDIDQPRNLAKTVTVE